MTTTTRTREEITDAIKKYFAKNEYVFNDCIEELDSYNGYLGDDRYYPMDELDELLSGLSPLEVLERTFYGGDDDTKDASGTRGEFNPNREYFYYNGYGNLCSTDYKDYSCHLDNYVVEAMADDRRHIDSIDNDAELCMLFDELEAIEA